MLRVIASKTVNERKYVATEKNIVSVEDGDGQDRELKINDKTDDEETSVGWVRSRVVCKKTVEENGTQRNTCEIERIISPCQ